ncbi:MAG: putative metalloprotease CJM1_0395 family protein [Pseudomonas sp.]|uniref:putative metalloprotease CJM1_0395 family protein n=1 Tax=Pseudomonas sp. TaxID=306 RepID=UPI0033929BE6
MLIGSPSAYVAPTPSALPARPVSPDASPDLARSNQAPATPAQAQDAPGQASAREEADREGAPQARPAGAQTAEQQRELQEIQNLSSRDREVRLHEQAHAAVGGGYTGSPTYSFKRGPDGKSYAVDGEVSVDASPVANDPAATLRKMAVVLRAALAPAEPSGQDRQVAAQAQAQASQARVDLAEEQRATAEAETEADSAKAEEDKKAAAKADAEATAADKTARPAGAPIADLSLYQRSAESSSAPRVDLVA